MNYRSTRGEEKSLTSAEAIINGQANDNGLYVPETFPKLSIDMIQNLIKQPYYKRASTILSMFLSDFTYDELETYSAEAYKYDPGTGFTDTRIAPVYKINDNTSISELWHGPTSAFKDMALQLMPLLLTASLKKTGNTKKACILVATSGDTGKAALEGFRDVPGTMIMVFYPLTGVSDVQKLQMTTQAGENVCVTAIEGNFDDAQTGVKSVFSDNDTKSKINEKNMILSSANSINWGRLVPQIVYYISSYCDMIKNNDIKPGEKINFCVPTGNFGNILSAYYAERMGLPINKLICASNRNDVLNQFIKTGVYNKNRPFYTTVSPSMDILISSNLERLLFELSEKDGKTVSNYMSSLSSDGQYKIPDSVKNELSRLFASEYCSEESTKQTIAKTFNEYNYLIDTHTAVAVSVLDEYRKTTGDDTMSVVVSTANPFKFCDAVLDALGQPFTGNAETLLKSLSETSGQLIPVQLAELYNLTPRFNKTVKINEMKNAVIDFIGGR